MKIGAPTLYLIAWQHEPDYSWRHTEKDTLDELRAPGFQIVGDLLLETLREWKG